MMNFLFVLFVFGQFELVMGSFGHSMYAVRLYIEATLIIEQGYADSYKATLTYMRLG